jgi:hypothetical protein
VQKVKNELIALFQSAKLAIEQMSKPELSSCGYEDQEVRVLLRKMENFDYQKFPGANPVSFSDEHMY